MIENKVNETTKRICCISSDFSWAFLFEEQNKKKNDMQSADARCVTTTDDAWSLGQKQRLIKK